MAEPRREEVWRCPPGLEVSRAERRLVLGGTVALLLLAIMVGLAVAPGSTQRLLAFSAASFMALGKFLPLVALTDPTFTFLELGLTIWVIDTLTVLILVYALEGLYHWPLAARILGRFQHKAGVVIDAFPTIRRYAFIGMVLFVLFPVSGTGAIGGTFVGILLGLHRGRIIAAVCLGGFIGGLGMAGLAERFGTAIESYRDSPWLVGALIAIIVLALLALQLAYRRALKRAGSSSGPEGADEGP